MGTRMPISLGQKSKLRLTRNIIQTKTPCKRRQYYAHERHACLRPFLVHVVARNRILDFGTWRSEWYVPTSNCQCVLVGGITMDLSPQDSTEYVSFHNVAASMMSNQIDCHLALTKYAYFRAVYALTLLYTLGYHHQTFLLLFTC